MQHQSHILTFGKILKGSTIKNKTDCLPLGNLTTCSTADGSISLHSSYFKERFHCCSGARKEAEEKFIAPAQIERFSTKKAVNVLDVCVGLGYNIGCLIEALDITNTTLNWWGLEIDRRPLNIALKNPNFNSSWSAEVKNILNSIDISGKWENSNSKGEILWGDAREKIFVLPKTIKFDLIMLDAFSPAKCPQLWTEEFLSELSKKLAKGGRLITFCRSAAIRGSLKRSGLKLASIIPIQSEGKEWSSGTVGFCTTTTDLKMQDRNPHWKLLSDMEEEHLLTNAAIPYRDQNWISTPKEIIRRRKEEQQQSELESTSSWRRRWRKAQSD